MMTSLHECNIFERGEYQYNTKIPSNHCQRRAVIFRPLTLMVFEQGGRYHATLSQEPLFWRFKPKYPPIQSPHTTSKLHRGPFLTRIPTGYHFCDRDEKYNLISFPQIHWVDIFIWTQLCRMLIQFFLHIVNRHMSPCIRYKSDTKNRQRILYCKIKSHSYSSI